MLDHETQPNATHAEERRPSADGPGIDQFLEGLESDVRVFLRTERAHLRLTVIAKAADLMSRASHRIIMLLVAGVSVLFLDIALALYLGQLLGAPAAGYAIVAAGHLLFLAVYQLYWSRGGRERSVLHFINTLHRDA
jgi:hypothetical protein